MTTSYDDVRAELFQELAGTDVHAEAYTNYLKNLELLNKAEAAQKVPETPEPKGAKAWFGKHSDAFIKVGGTLAAITLVGFVENKFDVIFRSKASKYI